MAVSYVLFLLAGVGFGYAATGLAKLLPLLFPLALALATFSRDGIEGEVLARLALAIVVTLIGVALGRLLEARAEAAGAT